MTLNLEEYYDVRSWPSVPHTGLICYVIAVAWMCRRSCVVRTRTEKRVWSANARREIERRKKKDETESFRQWHRDVNTTETTTSVILPRTRAALATDHTATTSTAVVAVVKGPSHHQYCSLVVSAVGIQTWGPGFDSRFMPLFRLVATFGKLFTHIASPVRFLSSKKLGYETSA